MYTIASLNIHLYLLISLDNDGVLNYNITYYNTFNNYYQNSIEVILIQPFIHNTIHVKQINTEVIKKTLKSLTSATKANLAQATGLSIATCGTILNELLTTGEVLEHEQEDSHGGRPAKKFMYNAHFSYIACIYIKAEETRHSLTYTVANSIGQYIESGHEEVSSVNATIIDHLIERLIHTYGNIKAIGIGIPGVAHQGMIQICDASELIGVPLESQLNEKYGIDIIIENDMNLTAYGFYQKQQYDQDKTIAVVTFIKGSFPGAGLMIDGHIHKGNTRFAGEISFLPFGITREEQYAQLHQSSTFIPLAAKMLISLIATINPEKIALTGDQIHSEQVKDLYNACLEYIPVEHMAELHMLKEPDQDYMHGLVSMTLESLDYALQLVEKRR